jgi:ketosteroid isomerase-like protein
MKKLLHCSLFPLLLLLAPLPAAAQSQTPADVVDAFHFALKAGERKKALELLSADVLVFEQGRLERSRSEYAKNHLHEDIGFSSVTQRSVARRAVKQQGNTAWVLSVNRIRGKFNNKPVDITTDETMVLTRTAGKWRIVHIHWSFNDKAPS